MLLAPDRSPSVTLARPHPPRAGRRWLAVAVPAVLALALAAVWTHLGSGVAAVLAAVLVNAALAPLPHARRLQRRPEPVELQGRIAD